MAASSGAVRAGGAFVELFAQDNKLYRALDKAEARVRAFGGKMAKAGAAIGAAGASVAGPLMLAQKFAIDDGAAVDRMSKSLNTSAEDLTAFGYAAAKSGVKFDELGGFLESLPDKLRDLADGGGASADTLKKLGVNGRDLINLPFNEQMEKLAQGVREVINPIDRASVATELFGESGKAMLPLLTQGAVGMRNFMNEAKATGQVMTGEQAGKAAAAQRALTSAYESARKAVVEVGMALIPSTEVIAKFSAYFEQGAAAVRDFIRANGGTIAVVAGAAVGVVALGTAVTAVGGIVAGVATAFGALVTAVTTVISVGAGIVGAILSPLGLIVVAVVAVVAAFLLLTDAGGEACDFLGDAFDELADVFGEAWGAIVTAVKAGDLSAAFAVVTSTLDLMLRRAVVKMTQAWNDFKGFFVDAWHDGLMLIELGMEAASTEIAKTMMDMLAFIAKNFSDTFNAIVEGAAKVADALNASETAATIRGAKDLVKLDTDGMKKMIDEDHNAANKKIFKDRAGQQDASDQSRGDDLKGAKSALVDAEAAFAKALGDAAEAGEKSEREKREKAAADKGPAASDGPKKPAALSNGELPSLSRGTFTSTSYGQMFAAPSVAGRQLREQEKTNEILKDVVKAVRENGDQEAATFK